MKTVNYASDRWLVRMLRQIAEQRGIAFSSLSRDWILELRKHDITHRVIGFRFDINDSVASQIAQDKVATHVVLAANHIPSIEHRVIRRQLTDDDRNAMQGWGRIIMKPLTGSGGHDVRLFDDVQMLSGLVQSSAVHAWAASPLAHIENETRIVLLDGEILLTYAKRPITIKGVKMFNLSLGGTAIAIQPSAEQIDMARRAQKAIGLRLCAVDIVSGNDLPLSVLEVNGAFGMEHYAGLSKDNEQQVLSVYDAIIERLFIS